MWVIWILAGIIKPLDLCHTAPSQTNSISSSACDFESSCRNTFMQPVFAIGHDQKEAAPIPRIDCAIGISVLSYMMAWHGWTDALCAPAGLRFVDPPKSRLILKHDMDSFGRVLANYFAVFSVNFFEEFCSSSLAAFGCLALGITFRHP